MTIIKRYRRQVGPGPMTQSGACYPYHTPQHMHSPGPRRGTVHKLRTTQTAGLLHPSPQPSLGKHIALSVGTKVDTPRGPGGWTRNLEEPIPNVDCPLFPNVE